VILTKVNRKVPSAYHLRSIENDASIERFFNKFKHFRAIATHCDKLAKIFLAGVQLASAVIVLTEDRP
jgi:hypothetical protein